jgi:uncharacterized membrane protein YwzB
MSSTSPTNTNANITPLKIYQIYDMLAFFSIYSPIILVASITSLSFLFQNFKGIIYLGFIISCCVTRNYIYMMSETSPLVYDNSICTSVQYSKYGNPTFSAFVFAFTITYLSIPMFTNGDPNFWLFLLLITYFIFDIFIKQYKKCIASISDLFINILLGVSISSFIITLMYSSGNGKYLFFNEISSNKDVCYQPKKQTFKCSLYKNGQLISGIN